MKVKIIILSILTVFVAAGAAMAGSPSPVGQWDVTFYIEPNLTTGLTQGICFNSNGTFDSTTYSSWSGYWEQKGERIRWTGFANIFSTADFGEFIAPTVIGGEYANFTSSLLISWGNWKAKYVKANL